ncbi:MAG: hypothetical protein MJE68_17195 [Proteobacteria bacterium]|nr:hypothetical protein [Pseudomonadota bacterium]
MAYTTALKHAGVDCLQAVRTIQTAPSGPTTIEIRNCVEKRLFGENTDSISIKSVYFCAISREVREHFTAGVPC